MVLGSARIRRSACVFAVVFSLTSVREFAMSEDTKVE
jgi:hypothetical protein